MKLKTFTYKDILSWGPCYSPSKYLSADWEGTALDILDDKRIPLQDRIWVIMRSDLVSEKLMRLFAVQCARQAQHLMKDDRSLKTLDVAEKFARGEATRDELDVARVTARDVARDVARYAARYVTRNASRDAARSATRYADWAAAATAQDDARYAAQYAAQDSAWAAAYAARAAARDDDQDDAWDVALDGVYVAQENKLREMLLAGIETGDVQVEDTKCLVCHEEITPEELSQISTEFKMYPAHQDCFDSFDSADEFLAFAKESRE